MTKEQEVICKVLELYKEKQYLWDRNHINYSNKHVRLKGYQEMLSVYKTIDDDATIKSLIKKINNLKTYYMREAKKVEESKLSGDVYVPTIWYYDYLTFFDAYEEPCRTSKVFKYTIKDEDSSSISLEDQTQLSSVSDSISNEVSFKRKRNDDPLEMQHNIVKKASGSTHQINTKEEDWELLGRSIGMQLRDLNQRQHVIARKLISDVIYYATLNKLTEESFVGTTTKF